ncbi:MAG: glycosyltransferase [Bryobacteraceae bacterium]
MSFPKRITFAVAVNNAEVFEGNFLASPCVGGSHGHQVLIQRDFNSAAGAYNEALDRSVNDLVVFVHQDMYLPGSWLQQLSVALDYLAVKDPKWGVLGVYGTRSDGTGVGHVYSSGLGVLGAPLECPTRVQTLDEIVLIIRKSSGLRFDSSLPNFHFYGADICLAAAERGMCSYAVSAFCVHNTQFNLVLPKEFYECYKHFKRSWKCRLPIQTSCVKVSNFDVQVHTRRLREAYLKYFRRNALGVARAEHIQELLEKVEVNSV